MNQLNYDIDRGVGVEGSLADIAGNKDAISRSAEGRVDFGKLVVIGTDVDEQCKLPLTSAEITTKVKVMGVSIADQARESQLNVLDPAYLDEDSVSVLRKGRIYVKVEDAFTPESAVYVRFEGVNQVSTILFDIDFEASNDIDLKINGVAITTVPFNASHAQTLTDLATEIQTNADVLSASAASRTITITAANDVDLAVTEIVVTGGSNQAVGVFAETTPAVKVAEAGSFRTDDNNVGGATAAALADARFLNSGSAGDLGILEVTLGAH